MTDHYIDIGRQLRDKRLELRGELKDISDDTRIPLRYLEAIEAGEVDAFPSIVYYNLFARAYAKELGFDPERMFAVMAEENLELDRAETPGEEVPEKELTATEPTKDRSGRRVLYNWIVTIIVVVMIGLAIYILAGNRLGLKSKSNIEKNISKSGHSKGLVMADTTEEIEKPVLALADTTTAAERTEKIDTMTLRIDVDETCWLLVMADSDTVLNRNLDSGDYRVFEAAHSFLVSAGNPPGISMELDGFPMKSVSRGGRPFRDFEITNENKNDLIIRPEKPAPERDSGSEGVQENNSGN
jgi:cytoskeleton protein RodZ